MRSYPALVSFTDRDRDALCLLPRAVGWRDSLDDWRAILACGRALGHRDASGEVVSCGVRFDYGPVTSIAKMVVRPDRQGEGLSRAVMNALLALGESPHVTLVATARGRPVYERMGFTIIGHVHKLIRERGVAPAGDATCAARAMGAGELDAVVAWDRDAFGADREHMLRARAQQVERCAIRGRGYGLRVRGELPVVGPVVADDEADARALVAALVGDGPCRIDVTDRFGAIAAWLAASGFTEVDRSPVMSLGGTRAPGQRARYVALASQGFA